MHLTRILYQTACKSHLAINSRKVNVSTKWQNFPLHDNGPILNQIAILMALQNFLCQSKVTNDLLMVYSSSLFIFQSCNCNNQKSKSYPGIYFMSKNRNIIKLNSKINIPWKSRWMLPAPLRIIERYVGLSNAEARWERVNLYYENSMIVCLFVILFVCLFLTRIIFK